MLLLVTTFGCLVVVIEPCVCVVCVSECVWVCFLLKTKKRQMHSHLISQCLQWPRRVIFACLYVFCEVITTLKEEFCGKNGLYCCADFQSKRSLTLATGPCHAPGAFIASLSLHMPGFSPRPAQVWFVVCTVALRHVFLWVFQISPFQYKSRNFPYLLVSSLTLHEYNLSGHIASLNDTHTHTHTVSSVILVCYVKNLLLQ